MGKKAVLFHAALALASTVAALPINSDSRWNMHLPGYKPGTHPDREDSNIDSFIGLLTPSKKLGDTLPAATKKPSVRSRAYRGKLYPFPEDHSPVERDFFRDDTGRPVHPIPAPSSADNEAADIGKRYFLRDDTGRVIQHVPISNDNEFVDDGKRDFFRDDAGRAIHHNTLDLEDSTDDIIASSLRGSHGLAGGPENISSQDLHAVHDLEKHHHPMHEPFTYLTARDKGGPPPDHVVKAQLKAQSKFNEKWGKANQAQKMQYLHNMFAKEPLTEKEYIRRYSKVFGYPYDRTMHINDQTFGNPWMITHGTH